MNISSYSQLPVLQESESPVPGDFFAVSADGNTGIRMNREGNGYVGMHLPNDTWARFDFAAPGLASLAWGASKPDNVPWLITQVEMPAAMVPAASLRRLYLLTCSPLPVHLCAFSPSIIHEEDAWGIFEQIPNVMLFALRNTTLVNPKFRAVVKKWEIALR